MPRYLVLEIVGLCLLVGCSDCQQKPPNCNDPQGTCACDTDQGMINLAPLDSKDPSNPRFSDVKDQKGTDTFYYNPCSAFSTGTCTDIAICQKTIFSYYYPCGDQDNVAWLTVTDPTSGDGFLALQYSSLSGGVRRTSTVKLVCDKSQEGSLTASGEDSPGSATYGFTLTSKYACAGGGGGGGLSAGSIILIIFVCLLAVYIIVGVIYNKVSRGAQGAEVLPNSSFWMDFPAKVKDGSCFLVHKCKCGTSQSDYESFS